MNFKLFFLSIGSLLFCLSSSADNKIIGFFESTPSAVVNALQQEGIDKKQLLPSLGGIPTLYGGYLSYSKKIEFPLRHAEPKLYIVITPKIKVVHTEGETIAYLALEKQPNGAIIKDTTSSTTATPGMEAVIDTTTTQTPTKTYLLEKKQDEKKVWFWHVSELPAPKNGKINPISLILVTNPNTIFIKTGDYITTEETHLRLPPIYVLGDADRNENLLNFLDLSRYFEPINKETKEEPEKVESSILTTN